MAWLLYDIENPLLRQLVIRKNFEDLKDWIDRAQLFYRPLKAVFNLSRKEIAFPSGAKIILGHLKDKGSYTKYQGHEYHRILIEELTHIPTEELYLKLISSCRSTVPGLTPAVFATTNPGEVGHRWVRKRFVDVAKDGELYKEPETGETRMFIQSKVTDNPTLMDRDPKYIKRLQGLPEGLRQQWLEGSWDDIEIRGAYYIKDIKQAQTEQRICRVEYEPNLVTDTFWDLGINDETSIWFVQRFGKEIRILRCVCGADESLIWWLNKIQEFGYAKNWGTFHFPHDIKMREYSNGEQRLQTVVKYAETNKFKWQVLPAINPEERVHATRLTFPKFWIDSVNCEFGLDALRAYRKEYDEMKLTYKNVAVHDWSSHPADAFGMIGLAYKLPEPKEDNTPRTNQARDPEGWRELEEQNAPRDRFCPF